MKHWFEVVDSLHLLWVASEEKSFTREIFGPLDVLGEDWAVSCWRVVQKVGEQGASLVERGPWHDLAGTVLPGEIALSGTLPALGQTSTAVFGLASMREAAAATAAELFEEHKNSSMWSCGVIVSRSAASSGGEMSTLPFAHWLDTRLGLGSASEPGFRLKQVLTALGPDACVVVPGASSDMDRATLWVSLRPLENSWLVAPGETTSSELAQRRGWGAQVLD